MSYYAFSNTCEDCLGTGGQRDPEGEGSCGTCDGKGRVSYGSFETFEIVDPRPCDAFVDEGWYWWACFPGCLPVGDPSGPFATEEEAIADAMGS